MKSDFYTSILKKDIEFFDSNKVGEITSRLNRDINSAQNISTDDFNAILRHTYETFASVLVLYSMSPKLSMILFAFSLVKVFMIKKRASMIIDHSK